jgi:hypothetical protein
VIVACRYAGDISGLCSSAVSVSKGSARRAQQSYKKRRAAEIGSPSRLRTPEASSEAARGTAVLHLLTHVLSVLVADLLLVVGEEGLELVTLLAH